MKYEVTTAIKMIATTATEVEALAIAVEAFETHNYVEVRKVVTISPWYAESVKILYR